MADKTGIEWTDATWNPIVGCSIVSPGCINCYAMLMAARIEKMAEARRPGGVLGPMTHYAGTTQRSKAGPVWTGHVAQAPDHILTAPLRWKRPRKIFVNSMGDLFHESIPDEWIDKVFAVMALCPQHTFQVLTKRAERMRAYVTPARRDAWSRAADPLGDWAPLSPQEYADRAHIFESVPDKRCGIWVSVFSRWPLPNVWLGVSAERQQEADERREHLRLTPSAVRFASYEPALGPIDWSGWEFLDWLISGGENGPRPSHPDWHRAARDFCGARDIAYYFKQWGTWYPEIDRDRDDPDWCQPYDRYREPHFKILNEAGGCGFHGARVHVMRRCSKKSAGRLLDGKEHNDMPGRAI